ncbi:MAG: hypothetical protein JSW31_11660, partial [Burkholderiales bacterium]
LRAVEGTDLAIYESGLVTPTGADGTGETTTQEAITGTRAWAGHIEHSGSSTERGSWRSRPPDP